MNQPAIVAGDGAGGCVVRVKAVPGARADAVAGPLGDRLKVRVSAPPEGGKANRAICSLLARTLGVRAAAVGVRTGPASAEKLIAITGVGPAEARARLGLGDGPRR